MNYTLLTDFYELTMAYGYFKSGKMNEITHFEVFYRSVPDNGGFVIASGLETIIDYVLNMSYSKEDIDFLRTKGMFDEEFLTYLSTFRFRGDIKAVKEGTPVFPNEPIVTVRGNAIEAQLVETYFLLAINHQSLIATKASRIVRAADGRGVMEFGSRRAQGESAAIYGARAAYIGGVIGSANVITDKMYGIPALGTMAHSWIMMFDSEYEAFKTYANIFPTNATLLIDTYNVLKSGLPNAMRVFKEVLEPIGIKKGGVRIDSGDLTYLSKKVRKILDANGLDYVKIVASNSLDEYIIESLLNDGAKIDSFGVGERLITSKSSAVLGGVYKLVAVEENGQIVPKIKISENPEKTTIAGAKDLYRLFDKETGKAIADVMAVRGEKLDFKDGYEIFDPVYTYKRKTLENFYAESLLEDIFIDGKLVYKKPHINEIKEYANNCINYLWDEVKRFENPHKYYVDYSQRLYDQQEKLLENNNK